MKRIAPAVAAIVVLVCSLQTVAQNVRPTPPRPGNVPRESVTTYEYDSLHRLTKVTYADGGRIAYEYDAVGNRTSKVVTAGRW